MLAKSNSRTTSARQGKGFLIGGIAFVLVAVGVMISDVNSRRLTVANQSDSTTVEVVVVNNNETVPPEVVPPQVPDTGIRRFYSQFGEGVGSGTVLMSIVFAITGIVFLKVYQKKTRRRFISPTDSPDIKFL
jgi:glucose uptake protein GlcU